MIQIFRNSMLIISPDEFAAGIRSLVCGLRDMNRNVLKNKVVAEVDSGADLTRLFLTLTHA